MSLAGHFRTLEGYLRRSLGAPRAPLSRSWETWLEDPLWGPVRLTGRLSEPPGARAVVVVVHGLGGSSESPYMMEAAARITGSGLACLRLNLRGADRTGEDIYHAGLIEDLVATFVSPQVERYENSAVLGFSLGGHVALRFAALEPAAHLRAVVAISPPLDLAATAAVIDSRSRWLYRRYLLARLFDIYSEVARRRTLVGSIERVRRCRTFVEFDSLVIAPRHGFADAWDYYRRVSVGPHLGDLETATLLVAASDDPMVPAASLEPHLRVASGALRHHVCESGGHLSFPADLDLGVPADSGLYPQVMGWLESRLPV